MTQSNRATLVQTRTRDAAWLAALPTAEVVEWAIHLADEVQLDRPFVLTIVARELSRPAVATYFAKRTRRELPPVEDAAAHREV